VASDSTSDPKEQVNADKKDSEVIEESRDQKEEHLAAIANARQKAESCANTVLEIQGSAQQALSEVAEKAKGVDASRNSASRIVDEIKKGHDEVVDWTAKTKQTVETYLNETKSNRDSTNEELESIKKANEEAKNLLKIVNEDSAKTKIIADTVESKDAKVKEYQEQLSKFEEEHKELKQRIEGLLPGATSAHLASAFERRKNTFKWPKVIWTVAYIGSAVGFIGVGVYLLFLSDNITSFRDLIFFALKKSPILAGMILLEEFSRRNYNITLRLEEDYAYKEVLSRSFEGYRVQMEKVTSDSGDKPVLKLSQNLLDSLAERPVRMFDKVKPEHVPPRDIWEQIVKAIKDFQGKKE